MSIQKIRNIDPRWDGERIIDLFRGAQVKPGSDAKTGFYDYPLSEEGIMKRIRACPELSLVLENNRGEFLAYLLAYKTRDIDSGGLLCGYAGPVLKKLRGANPRAVYIDQLCISPGIPVFVAGRLADVWNNIVYGEKFDGRRLDGSVCAIPSAPWVNVSSRRLVLARGYSRVGQVKDKGVTLDIFAKPHWKKDVAFDSAENFLGTNFKN